MKSLVKICLLIAVLIFPINSYGQIKVDFKKKVINQTNSRANQAADKTISKGLDAVEDGVTDAVTGGDDKDKDQADKSASDANSQSDSGNKSESAKTGNSAKQEQPALQTYSKYDFMPGEKIIFYEDFSQDAVGDFPALWNTNGSAEIVTTNLFPGNWMKFDCREAIWTDALLTLPDNYTIEFDIIPTSGSESNGGMSGYSFRLMQAINAASYDHGAIPGKAAFALTVEYFGRPGYRTYINLDGAENLGLSGYKEDDALKQKKDQKYHMALWYQKGRVRLYQDQNKLFDLPKAFTFQGVKMDRIRFEYGAAMVTNVRIAVGAPDMRNKLLTEGKLVTYGIYFDVNKDVVKPESYGTLKSIAAILTENPDIRVKIVGYTDSDGADAANLDLSKRRGASVKNELVKSFGIDDSRLESDGLGETQPIAPNDSQANKALNRRVELIKL
jgi:OmpA-OmpF porin, OOP family